MEWLKSNAAWLGLAAAAGVAVLFLNPETGQPTDNASGDMPATDYATIAYYAGASGIAGAGSVNATAAQSSGPSEALSKYAIDAQIRVAELAFNTTSLQAQASLLQTFMTSGNRIVQGGFAGGLQFNALAYGQNLSNYLAEQIINRAMFSDEWNPTRNQINAPASLLIADSRPAQLSAPAPLPYASPTSASATMGSADISRPQQSVSTDAIAAIGLYA